MSNREYIQPTVIGKSIIFGFGCSLILWAMCVKILVSTHTAIRLSRIDIALAALLGYIVLNRYILQPDFGFSVRFLELLGLGILYIAVRNISLKDCIWLAPCIVVSAILQVTHGYLQLADHMPTNHSGFKLTGSFFNPGPYAGFLTAAYTVSLGLFLYRKNIKEILIYAPSRAKRDLIIREKIVELVFRYMPLVGIVGTLTILPITRSRAAWTSVLLASLVLLEYRFGFVKALSSKFNSQKRNVLYVAIFILLTIGAYGTYKLKKDSADGRLFIWKITEGIIMDFPAFGVGFDGFKAHYMNYQANYFSKHGETKEASVADDIYYAFNDWLQFMAENGLIGVLILGIVFYFLFKTDTSYKNRFLFIINQGLLLVVGIFALFSYPVQILPIKLVIAVALASMANIDEDKLYLFDIKNMVKPHPVRVYKIIVLLAATIFIPKGIMYVQTLDRSYRSWKNALSIYQYGAFEEAIETYRKTCSVLKKEGDFLMNYGKALEMYKKNKEAIDVLEQAKSYLNTTIIETALGNAYKGIERYDKAEKAYQTAAKMVPNRFYPLYLQVKLYEESGDKEKMIAMAKVLLKKEIKVPSVAIDEIREEMEGILRSASDRLP